MTTLTPYPVLRRQVEEILIGGQKKIEALKVEIYWKTGRLIVRYLEAHPEEGSHGKKVMARLSRDLSVEVSLFYRMLQFTKAFPNFAPGRNLTWTHYRALLAFPDDSRRIEFQHEARKNAWSVRRLRLEIARHFPDKKAALEGFTPLIEPPRPRESVQRIAWLAGLDGKKRKVVDLGFDTYRELSDSEKKGFQIGDCVTWQSSAHKWKRSPNKEALYFYRGEIERVVDGDTLLVHVDLGFDLKRRQYLRLRGINTEELATPRGQKARDFILRAVKKSKQIEFKSRFTDRYDRYLSDVWVSLAPNPTGTAGKRRAPARLRRDLDDFDRADNSGTTYLNQALLDAGLAKRVDY